MLPIKPLIEVQPSQAPRIGYTTLCFAACQTNVPPGFYEELREDTIAGARRELRKIITRLAPCVACHLWAIFLRIVPETHPVSHLFELGHDNFVRSELYSCLSGKQKKYRKCPKSMTSSVNYPLFRIMISDLLALSFQQPLRCNNLFIIFISRYTCAIGIVLGLKLCARSSRGF